jgi:hypothetical protein
MKWMFAGRVGLALFVASISAVYSNEACAQAKEVLKQRSGSTEQITTAIDTAPELKKLVDQLAKEPVKAADARRIAMIYENCGIFYGPKDYEQFYVNYVRMMPPGSQDDQRKRLSLVAREYQRCATLLENKFDVYKARKHWLQRAAKAGDVAAKLALRLEATPTQENIKAYEAEIKQALNSKDPEILWEASKALGHAGYTWFTLTGKEFPPDKEGKPMDGLRAVFQSSACSIGYPCGQNSVLLKNFCIRGTCASSYSAWLPTFLTAEQNKAVQAELPRVEKALRAGKGSALIFGVGN